MKKLEDFDKAFETYKKATIFIPDQQELKKMIEYVYESNRLEGNELNLFETTKVITENRTPANARLNDILECKGHFKAIRFAVMAARNKYPLTEKILKEINRNILSSLWAMEDFYTSYKNAGQELGEYKVKDNKIQYSYEGNDGEIMPVSNSENVKDNMREVIERINNFDGHLLEKAGYLSYQIFINQPFPDGNKRTARLLSTYLVMKEGLPLLCFNIQKNPTFNSALLKTHIDKDQKVMVSYLAKEFTSGLNQIMEKEKKFLDDAKNKGFNYVL